jgi:hypothetical protein
MDLPCDLPYNILTDGCSENCQVEDNFTCALTPTTYTTANGTSLTPSTTQCAFTGAVDIHLASVQQLLTSNSVQLTFVLTPYLQGMPLSSADQVYLKSIFLLSGTLPLADYSVALD